MTARRSRQRIREGLAVGLGLLALAGTSSVARAQAPAPRLAEPFRLVWSSSADCGDARTFRAELTRRTALLRDAQTNEHAITLIVETFFAPGGVRGRLTVRKPDGELTVREIPASNCREVESAIALIAALMVDPLAGAAERAGVDQRAEPAQPPPEASTTPRTAAWSLLIEQRLTARTAIAPGLSWGQALALMLTREASGLRPSVGVSGLVSQATASAAHGSAELTWAAAQLSACPVGLPNESWDLRGCGTFQLGRLRGSGFETASPASKSIWWSSVGVELQLRYRLLGPLWLGAEGGFSLPFSRERFYVEPDETLHQVPAWSLGFGLGLGVRFF